MFDDQGAPLPPDVDVKKLIGGWERDGRVIPIHSAADEGGEEETEQERRTQKEQLVALVEGEYLFRDERDQPFVWLKRDAHREVVPLDSARFRNWLSYHFYQETAKVPGSGALSDALSDALSVLCGRARFEGERHELGNRLARDEDGHLWYDLSDDAWRAIRITADGWVEDEAPLLFRRYSHQQPQVLPAAGFRSLREELSPFLNLSTDADELLVIVWLVAALLPDIPRTILVPHGPQGSAKSTLTRMLRVLIDPSSVPMPRFPRGDAEI